MLAQRASENVELEQEKLDFYLCFGVFSKLSITIDALISLCLWNYWLIDFNFKCFQLCNINNRMINRIIYHNVIIIHQGSEEALRNPSGDLACVQTPSCERIWNLQHVNEKDMASIAVSTTASKQNITWTKPQCLLLLFSHHHLGAYTKWQLSGTYILPLQEKMNTLKAWTNTLQQIWSVTMVSDNLPLKMPIAPKH